MFVLFALLYTSHMKQYLLPGAFFWEPSPLFTVETVDIAVNKPNCCSPALIQ